VKRVVYLPRARKALLRHRADAKRIVEKIAAYAADPTSQGNNVKRLKGALPMLRLRVGDYRVLFTEDMEGVQVLDIGSRGSIYG
jgi:mRNA interferase RelE/StbE